MFEDGYRLILHQMYWFLLNCSCARWPKWVEAQAHKSPLHLLIIQLLELIELLWGSLEFIPGCPVLLDFLVLHFLGHLLFFFLDLLELLILVAIIILPPHQSTSLNSQNEVHLLSHDGVRMHSELEWCQLNVVINQIVPVVVQEPTLESSVE